MMSMNTIAKPSLVFCFFLLCHLHGRSYALPRCEREVEFSYEERTGRGPLRWAQLDRDWFLCGNGTMQSPIAINNRMAMLRPTLGPLQTNYVAVPATLSSSGHNVQVLWAGGAGSITINGTVYKLMEAHWHTPAEHILNGIRHAMELHLVHESAMGQIAVVAVLYRYGRPDPFIESLYEAIRSLGRDQGQIIDVGIVDPRDIDQYSGTNNNYYRYMGSLATPPCSENVVWTVREKIQTVSLLQVLALKRVVDDEFEENARPIQPLNGRPVFKFEL